MSKSASTANKTKIGMLGLGYWGKNLMRNLYAMGVLHMACDSDAAVIAERKKDFPKVRYGSSPEEILKDSRINAVVIATPAVTHYRLAAQALKAGKDVFVEKPIALTVKQGEDLRRLAVKKKKILMVGHILQYHPAVIKLKEMIVAGDLGQIRYVYSNRLNIGKLRAEENILWSFAPHDISVILSLIGEEPVRVTAFGGDYLSRGVGDVTLTTLEFQNNVKAHVFVSWLHPYKEQKLIVVGSKAMAVFDDVSKEKLFIYPHKIEWKDGKVPVARKADFQTVPVDAGEPLRKEMEHFVACVRRRQTPKTDAAEGINVLRVLEQAEMGLRSPASGGGEGADYFVHPTSCVDEDVRIGRGSKIWHFSHILKNSQIGNQCIICQNVMIGPDVRIGHRCKIQNNVSVFRKVTLEDDVFCGPSCVFTNVNNPRAFIERKKEFRPTLVKKGATIGANATIVCGATVGEFAFIGAGAVVTKDVPDYALVVGVPARRIGWMCRCGVRLKPGKTRAACKTCGARYKIMKNKISAVDSAG